MATPIIEEIGSFLESALNEITVANGFNYDITATRKKRLSLLDEVFNDLSAYILQGVSERNGTVLSKTGPRPIKQEYKIWVCCIESDTSEVAIDTKLNAVRSDVEKKLCEDPTCGGFAMYRSGLLGNLVSERFLLVKLLKLRKSKGTEQWERSQI